MEVVLFLLILAMVAGPIQGVEIAEKDQLDKQKFLLEIVYRLEDPLMIDDYINTGKRLIVDKANYTKFDNHMEKFLILFVNQELLPKNEFFGALVKSHIMQARGLVSFFLYAKDWETFENNVAWARMYINEGMFVYALNMALRHREDLQDIYLPPIYDMIPQYFLPSTFVWEAEKFDFEVWNKSLLFERDFYKSFYEKKRYEKKNHFHMQGWKKWQWWRLLGMDYQWYAEGIFPIPAIIYAFDPNYKWLPYMFNITLFWMPVDYTRDIEIFNEQSQLSYFTEDVGWNAYWYYLNMDYAFFLPGDTFQLNKDRRGEWWLYNVQQLLARYYQERLSHGFGDIPTFSWYGKIKDGYDPKLVAYNGMNFRYRKNWWDIRSNGKSEILSDFFGTAKRILNIIDAGYYETIDGSKIDLRKPESIEYIANILQGNVDSPDPQLYSFWTLLYHMFVSNVDYDAKVVSPNVFLNFETMMRDPLFYMIYKKTTVALRHFKNHLEPYTEEELLLPGVEIKSASVTDLISYFNTGDVDATNLLNNKLEMEDGEIVWNQTLLARQAQLNHKPFNISLTVESDKIQKVVLRTFLGPKFDQYGGLISLADNGENFVELDEFMFELVGGTNQLNRSAEDFSRTVKEPYTYTELYYHVRMATKGDSEYPLNTNKLREGFPDISTNRARGGFPNRLILPHGSAEGMPMQFFFIISPYSDDSAPSQNGPIDKLPFGYPLDRKIDENKFYVPNMYFKDVKIYHKLYL